MQDQTHEAPETADRGPEAPQEGAVASAPAPDLEAPVVVASKPDEDGDSQAEPEESLPPAAAEPNGSEPSVSSAEPVAQAAIATQSPAPAMPDPADESAAPVDYSRTFRSLNEGDVVEGTVVHIDREGVLVDVGTKSEGLVPPQELSRGGSEGSQPMTVGDKIDVYVLEAENQDGNLILSKKRADFEKAWERVMEARDDQRTITAMVTDRVKGGLVVDLGIRGFIPASHVGSGKVRNLEKYIGQSLPLKVIEVDKERRKVVLSHRLATEEEREQQRETTVSSLTEGQPRPGVVRRITDYGAFVDLGGIDGLLHISEMSWTRIKHPSEVVKVGDKIQVQVLKVNMEQNRISLGLRQILPDPWVEAMSRFKVGDVVKGEVSRLVPFGAFVQLDGGIEGIIPNGELSQKRVSKPEGTVKVGDQVEVKVMDIQPEERRMTLSKKALERQRESDEHRESQRSQPRDRERFTIGDVLREQLEGHGSRGERRGRDVPAEETAEPVAEAASAGQTAQATEAAPVAETAPAEAMPEDTAVRGEEPSVEEAGAEPGESREATEVAAE